MQISEFVKKNIVTIIKQPSEKANYNILGPLCASIMSNYTYDQTCLNVFYLKIISGQV